MFLLLIICDVQTGDEDLTMGVFVFLELMIALVAGVPAVIGSIGLPVWIASAVSILRWPLLDTGFDV